MYKVYADDILIYDSTIEDHDMKLVKGNISLETNKSGSFIFSIQSNHFYYDSFVKLKTVITVYKGRRIKFRGRVLSEVINYWNEKELTCEGELGFFQDSVVRPFSFTGKPKDLFVSLINHHNAEVEDFKKFKIGEFDVVDENLKITRYDYDYSSSFDVLTSRFVESDLGGYFYITHGEDGTDPIPTLNYKLDFNKVASQTIEFGSNLRDYTRTVKADDVATVIIPLGVTVDDGNANTTDTRLTIADVNNGKDYLYDSEAVKKWGWIAKSVIWDDITDEDKLKAAGIEYLKQVTQQVTTIDLTAIDLHILDKSVESFNICDYIHVVSKPHKFDNIMLCSKQEIDIFNPENDKVILGYTYSSLTEMNSKMSNNILNIVSIKSSVDKISKTVIDAQEDANEALESYKGISSDLQNVSGDIEALSNVIIDNARNIATNAQNIATNSENIATNTQRIEEILVRLASLENPESGEV